MKLTPFRKQSAIIPLQPAIQSSAVSLTSSSLLSTTPLALLKRTESTHLSRTLRTAVHAFKDVAGAMTEEQKLVELNQSLETLAVLFPNIQHEVFREMLTTFPGDSRLEVITEQLLKQKEKYVNGRWRVPTQERVSGRAECGKSGTSVAVEDQFRRESYKTAARRALYLEFNGLSRSTINAVLAEKNYCYTLSRPTLQKITARSWRRNISDFFSKWRKPTGALPTGHFMLEWPKKQPQSADSDPRLQDTGDAELDRELHLTVLAPLLEEKQKKQRTEDWRLALNIHERESKEAGVVYECECCFSDTTFELMSTCTRDGHVICFGCLRNAVNEALFGQSWGRNIDHECGQVRCLAPTAGEGCAGCIPDSLVKRAVCQGKNGTEVWIKLESRLAEANLLKAQMPLVRCPFCPYAECDEIYLPPSAVHYRLNTSDLFTSLILLVLLFNLIPVLILYCLIYRSVPFFKPHKPSSLFSTSLIRLARSRHLSRRFMCRSPACGTASCISCSKAWHDPHICYESATLSLRKTIEAARTAALKRICPRCRLGFIKESGCNKLTCVCGYVMCYICRRGLGRGQGNEGYEHFCQHFRPAGGKCTACEKCDLYAGEDEDGAVRTAGQLAEQEWREREGMVGVEGIGGGQCKVGFAGWWKNDWTVQDVVDWYVARLLTC